MKITDSSLNVTETLQALTSYGYNVKPLDAEIKVVVSPALEILSATSMISRIAVRFGHNMQCGIVSIVGK